MWIYTLVRLRIHTSKSCILIAHCSLLTAKWTSYPSCTRGPPHFALWYNTTRYIIWLQNEKLTIFRFVFICTFFLPTSLETKNWLYMYHGLIFLLMRLIGFSSTNCSVIILFLLLSFFICLVLIFTIIGNGNKYILLCCTNDSLLLVTIFHHGINYCHHPPCPTVSIVSLSCCIKSFHLLHLSCRQIFVFVSQWKILHIFPNSCGSLANTMINILDERYYFFLFSMKHTIGPTWIFSIITSTFFCVDIREDRNCFGC